MTILEELEELRKLRNELSKVASKMDDRLLELDKLRIKELEAEMFSAKEK